MSRKLMRVPMDFKWPKNQVWKGYLNPIHSQPCKSCEGTGLSPEAKAMQDEWYGSNFPIDGESWKRAWSHNLTKEDVQALVDADRLWDFTRRPRTEAQKKKSMQHPNGWLKKPNGYIPTPEEVNEWSLHGLGHDSINSWVCVKARCEREGVKEKCEFCEGHGHIWQNEKVKRAHDRWKPFDPPKGDGFQLWETTSEGSPQSPVFATLEELCEWCEINASTFSRYKTTKEEWMKMLDEDFVYHREGNVVFM